MTWQVGLLKRGRGENAAGRGYHRISSATMLMRRFCGVKSIRANNTARALYVRGQATNEYTAASIVYFIRKIRSGHRVEYRIARQCGGTYYRFNHMDREASVNMRYAGRGSVQHMLNRVQRGCSFAGLEGVGEAARQRATRACMLGNGCVKGDVGCGESGLTYGDSQGAPAGCRGGSR